MSTPAIPERMKHLPLDKRGYPVPFVVLRDGDGEAHFAINDTRVSMKALRDELCSICGTPLYRGRWYVGGPASAFHEHGAFIDPPMHADCLRYALQVCPYLAAPVYARKISTEKLAGAAGLAAAVDPTMNPERPPLFVAVMALGHELHVEQTGRDLYLHPHRPYRAVEFWVQGQQLDDLAGRHLCGLALQREFNYRIGVVAR